MSYYYAIGPWVWEPETTEDVAHWRAPAGTIGIIDTRPTGGTVAETGFFAFNALPSLGAEYTVIGNGDRLEEYFPTGAEASAWEAAYGVAPPGAGSLLDWLVHLLDNGDPDGVLRLKPWAPDANGDLVAYLGGHSRIYRRRFQGESDPGWPAIQGRLQADYRTIRARSLLQVDQRNREAYRRWLETTRRKLRLSVDDVQRLIIPSDLPRERPLPPRTVVADTFNRPDNADVDNSNDGKTVDGSPASWLWEEQDAGSNAISGNEWVQGAISNFGDTHYADSNLSSTDHITEITVGSGIGTASGDHAEGQFRVADFSNKYYIRLQSDNSLVLRKEDAGSHSDLSSDGITAVIAGDRLSGESNGNTIRSLKNDVEVASVTDTTHSTGLVGGLHVRGAHTIEEWKIEDLGPGPSVQFKERGFQRGVMRGVR